MESRCDQCTRTARSECRVVGEHGPFDEPVYPPEVELDSEKPPTKASYLVVVLDSRRVERHGAGIELEVCRSAPFTVLTVEQHAEVGHLVRVGRKCPMRPVDDFGQDDPFVGVRRGDGSKEFAGSKLCLELGSRL